MGKAADNEAIKLQASYNNNLAAGATGAGIIGPYLLLVQRIMEGKHVQFVEGAAIVFTIVVAFAISWKFKRRAQDIIATLQD
jgi:hypothetical protein